MKILLHKLTETSAGEKLRQQLIDVSFMAMQYMIEHKQALVLDANAPESPFLESLVTTFTERRRQATELVPELATKLPSENRLAIIAIVESVLTG